MAGVELPVRAIREQIASGLDLLVHIARLVDGTRQIFQITEITGMEGEVVTLRDLFLAAAWEGLGCEPGMLRPLEPTGLRPNFLSKLLANGVDLAPSAWLGHA